MMTRSPDAGLVGRRAVHGDDPRAGLGADRVGREALAAGDVVDLDLLVLEDAGELQQVGIDRARALVIELCVSHAGPV
jgi:hypothetical protein